MTVLESEIESAVRLYKSMTTSRIGCEQQTRRLPSAHHVVDATPLTALNQGMHKECAIVIPNLELVAPVAFGRDNPNTTVQFLDIGHLALPKRMLKKSLSRCGISWENCRTK